MKEGSMYCVLKVALLASMIDLFSRAQRYFLHQRLRLMSITVLAIHLSLPVSLECLNDASHNAPYTSESYPNEDISHDCFERPFIHQ